MVLLLFILLLSLPVLEILIYITAAGSIGWLSVILLTVFTAALGTYLIRRQGFSALQELQASMQDGRVPVAPAVDGVFLMMAAPLMMTPGFLTDAIGFAFLIPPIRHGLARIAIKRLKTAMDKGTVTIIRS